MTPPDWRDFVGGLMAILAMLFMGYALIVLERELQLLALGAIASIGSAAAGFFLRAKVTREPEVLPGTLTTSRATTEVTSTAPVEPERG